MSDDAEDIAKVVADIRSNKIIQATKDPRLHRALLNLTTDTTTVVNATAVYEQLSATIVEYNFYDDFPSMAPPWVCALVCYRNQHGNVVVMAMNSIDRRWGTTIEPWEPDPSDNKTVEWDEVRWIFDVAIISGGRGGKGPMPTVGPVGLWRMAVYETGAMADIRWVEISEYPMKHWDMALLTFESTINFMGCRNVELVPQHLPRATRRRLERVAGEVRLGVLAVRPTGKSSQGRTAGNPASLPMSSVRGHPAHYGDCCPGRHDPRGLLFGKLEGRFWVPQHARGSKEFGEVRNDYVIEPERVESNAPGSTPRTEG